MRTARVSIMGLYNYDQTIFDLMQLPEGIDRDTLITSILTECSDLEALYPNPEVMKALIGRWAYASNYAWKTLIETTQFEYNPLDNYDRTETRVVHREGEGEETDGGSDSLTSTDSGTDSADTEITRKNDVAGFEAVNDQYADRDKETSDSSTTTTYGKRNTTTNNYGKTNNNSFENDENETIRAHGNIGVTTSMQLIQEQRNIAQFNIYDFITDDFKKRYCILVY